MSKLLFYFIFPILLFTQILINMSIGGPLSENLRSMDFSCRVRQAPPTSRIRDLAIAVPNVNPGRLFAGNETYITCRYRDRFLCICKPIKSKRDASGRNYTLQSQKPNQGIFHNIQENWDIQHIDIWPYIKQRKQQHLKLSTINLENRHPKVAKSKDPGRQTVKL